MTDRLDDAELARITRWLVGGVWRSASVSEEPQYEVVRWRIMEWDENAKPTELANSAQPPTPMYSRHIVAYVASKREGRVSVAIQKLDPVARIAVTASGRTYVLRGEPGYDDDAQYVLEAYMRALGRSLADVRDVTTDALGLGAASRGCKPRAEDV